MNNERRGCLAGLLELTLLTVGFNWLEEHLGFGRGCSCTGCGCGFLLLILFILFACGIIFGTNWTKLDILPGWPGF